MTIFIVVDFYLHLGEGTYLYECAASLIEAAQTLRPYARALGYSTQSSLHRA